MARATLPLAREAAAVGMLAQGLPHDQIAKDLKMCVNTVGNVKIRQKEQILKLAHQLMDQSTEIVRDNHLKTISIANYILNKTTEDGKPDLDLISQHKDIIKLSDLKEFRILQIMGIAPSNTQSIVVNQIFGDIALNFVDPGVRQLLGGQLNQLEDDTLEAEVIE
jgi:hypothetical protein